MARGVTAEQTIIGLIVFAAGFIVLLIIYNALFVVGKSEFTEKECQSSLQLGRAVDYAQIACFAKVTNPIPLKCSRHFITVKDSSVMKDGNDVTSSYSPACPGGGNSCLAKNAVAEEMRTCWRTFFEGEQIVLQQVEVGSLKILSQKDYKRACFICGEITLQTTADVNEFTQYLKDKPMPVKSNQTYFSYFNNEKAWCDKDIVTADAPSCWEGMGKAIPSKWTSVLGYAESERPEARPVNIQTGKTYAVAFVRRGWGSCDNTKTPAGINHQYLTNSVLLVPVDQITKECDAVVA